MARLRLAARGSCQRKSASGLYPGRLSWVRLQSPPESADSPLTAMSFLEGFSSNLRSLPVCRERFHLPSFVKERSHGDEYPQTTFAVIAGVKVGAALCLVTPDVNCNIWSIEPRKLTLVGAILYIRRLVMREIVHGKPTCVKKYHRVWYGLPAPRRDPC